MGMTHPPTRAEAMDEPFAAFPSWLIRIRCDRCGKDRFLVETHFDRRDMLLRDIIRRMRHDGCGGRAGKVELLTGIEGVTSRPVRRIVLIHQIDPPCSSVARSFRHCNAGITKQSAKSLSLKDERRSA